MDGATSPSEDNESRLVNSSSETRLRVSTSPEGDSIVRWHLLFTFHTRQCHLRVRLCTNDLSIGGVDAFFGAVKTVCIETSNAAHDSTWFEL